MDKPEQPRPSTPPPAQVNDADRRLLSRLQGEDGYEIFTDDKGGNARERLRREQEDSRW